MVAALRCADVSLFEYMVVDGGRAEDLVLEGGKKDNCDAGTRMVEGEANSLLSLKLE